MRERVQGSVLHTGDVIVHDQEPGQVGEMGEPGGGDHLEVVVSQREAGEAREAGQGVSAEGEDIVVGEVQGGE